MKTLAPSTEKEIWALANTHYENFPVSPWFFPRSIRQALKAIYAFARLADDLADNGKLSQSVRLSGLNQLKNALKYVDGSSLECPSPFFQVLRKIYLEHELPIAPFYDLLDAFSQDVTKDTYDNMDELLKYCERSANPVGRLVLALYKEEEHTAASDAVCTALQLINFAQDVPSDLKDRNRCYIPKTDLSGAHLTTSTLLYVSRDKQQQALSPMLIVAHRKLIEGQPLRQVKPFTLRLYCRCVIESAALILKRLDKRQSFYERPILGRWDRVIILLRSLLGRSSLPKVAQPTAACPESTV